MNIALEQTEEYVNGQLKNKYGDAFIRGNNGKPIHILTRAYSSMIMDVHFYIIVLYISTTRRR